MEGQTKFKRYFKEVASNEENTKTNQNERCRGYSLNHSNQSIDKENQVGQRDHTTKRNFNKTQTYSKQKPFNNESPKPLGEIEKNREVLASEMLMKNVNTMGLDGWETDSPIKLRARLC